MDFAVHGAIEIMPLSKPVRDASAVLMQSSHSCHVLYVCGDSFADVECDDDSVLNIIYNLSCNSRFRIVPLEIPSSALFVLLKKI